jgi:leucyl-tRNA---protein transferase
LCEKGRALRNFCVIMEEASSCLYMTANKVDPWDMDMLWAEGWRHFGTFFFRDTKAWHNHQITQVLPLRINLQKFELSKSQRKLLRKNEAIQVVFREAFVDEQKEAMFFKHSARFTENIPDSIYDFMSESPAKVPCPMIECCLFDKDKLFAVSFLDVGLISTSSVYAMFDPDFADKSPGIHTLLEEIKFSQQYHKHFLYTGYAYEEASCYDYKKKFSGTEYYDWEGNWWDL